MVAMIFAWLRRQRRDSGPWLDVIDLEPQPERGDGQRTELADTGRTAFAVGDPRQLEASMNLPEGTLGR